MQLFDKMCMFILKQNCLNDCTAFFLVDSDDKWWMVYMKFDERIKLKLNVFKTKSFVVQFLFFFLWIYFLYPEREHIHNIEKLFYLYLVRSNEKKKTFMVVCVCSIWNHQTKIEQPNEQKHNTYMVINEK